MSQSDPSPQESFHWNQQHTLAPLAPDSLTHMPVRCVDWERLKRRIGNLPQPTADISAWYHTLLGIAIPTLLSVITLALSPGVPAGITMVYVAIGLATLLVGLFCLWFKRRQGNRTAVEAGEILKDMEDIEQTFELARGPAMEVANSEITHIEQQIVFRDDFEHTSNLSANWEFEGSWSVPEKGTLRVTNADRGGITRVGELWEDYTFEFSAHITRENLGVVVRSYDLNNYEMLQITPKHVVPHHRLRGAWEPCHSMRQQHKHEVRKWFEARVVVRGRSVKLYIDDDLVFRDDSFLELLTGRVGFRCSGTEQALIRRVRVTLHVQRMPSAKVRRDMFVSSVD